MLSVPGAISRTWYHDWWFHDWWILYHLIHRHSHDLLKSHPAAEIRSSIRFCNSSGSVRLSLSFWSEFQAAINWTEFSEVSPLLENYPDNKSPHILGAIQRRCPPCLPFILGFPFGFLDTPSRLVHPRSRNAESVVRYLPQSGSGSPLLMR